MKKQPIAVVVISVSFFGSSLNCGVILGLNEFSDAEGSGVGGSTATTADSGSSTSAAQGGADPGLAPTVPVPRLPMNGADVGTMRKSRSRRPRFAWEASTGTTDQPVEYELQYGTDPTMADAATIITTRADYQLDSDLEVELLPPVGRRYYWRVRACSQGTCSSFSPVRWFNVGRVRCDFNADGYDDVAVGAVSPTMNDINAVYFYYGAAGAAFDTTSDGRRTRPHDSVSGFGAALSCAGDVDGDGFADLLVGAPFSANLKGGAWVYFSDGGDSFSGTSVEFHGSQEGVEFGGALAGAGDVNGDGFDDVIVGEVGGPYAHLYHGDSAGRLSSATMLSLDMNVSSMVAAVASAGDVNGDGFSDVIVSFQPRDSLGIQAVGLYFGGTGLGPDAVPDVELAAPMEDSNFGSAIAAAGDVNGDGFGDVIIGSNGLSRSYIYLGAPDGLEPVPFLTLEGKERTNFGLAVASAGDMNGDGFGDVAVGTSDYSGDPGTVYIYMGGAGAMLNGAADVAFHRPANGDGFGPILGSSGDVNGDGFSDLTISAPQDGAIFMYFGKSESENPDPEDGSVIQPLIDLTFGAAVARR
ncbi:FG-GAP-like repeat-containing protein [Sorangium sp. So ce1000]|uniref:FG-GAP-like repeat-containing protein n=1 Tax=Sorangium sp. So ce1000 TaxID=3133325 RepID=UPI003F60762C